MENKEIILIKNREYIGPPTLEITLIDYGKNWRKECPTCKHISGPGNRIEYSVHKSVFELDGRDNDGKKYVIDFQKLKEFRHHLEEEFYSENEEFSNKIRNDPNYLEKKVIDYLEFYCESKQSSKWYSLIKNKIMNKKIGVGVEKISLKEVIDSKNNHWLDMIFIDLYPANIKKDNLFSDDVMMHDEIQALRN